MTKVRFTRSALATVLLVAAHSGIASAQITITPPAPTSVDSIHVVMADAFSMGCWDMAATHCSTAAPDSVLITADIQYCNGAPGCFCTAFPEAFQVTCDFAPLPPGTYRVVYRERYLNPADIRNIAPRMKLFTVSAPTPTLRHSWGRLKAIYR